VPFVMEGGPPRPCAPRPAQRQGTIDAPLCRGSASPHAPPAPPAHTPRLPTRTAAAATSEPQPPPPHTHTFTEPRGSPSILDDQTGTATAVTPPGRHRGGQAGASDRGG
jgi:hypothetical protein